MTFAASVVTSLPVFVKATAPTAVTARLVSVMGAVWVTVPPEIKVVVVVLAVSMAAEIVRLPLLARPTRKVPAVTVSSSASVKPRCRPHRRRQVHELACGVGLQRGDRRPGIGGTGQGHVVGGIGDAARAGDGAGDGEQLIGAAGGDGHGAGAGIHIGRGRGVADGERAVGGRDSDRAVVGRDAVDPIDGADGEARSIGIGEGIAGSGDIRGYRRHIIGLVERDSADAADAEVRRGDGGANIFSDAAAGDQRERGGPGGGQGRRDRHIAARGASDPERPRCHGIEFGIGQA